MNEKPEHQPILSDDQVDGLLSAFYQSEIPARLNQLPSTWESIASTESGGVQSNVATSVVGPADAHVRRTSATGRGFAVAVTALAACLMIMVFSQPATESNTADNKPEISLDNEDTATVSGNGGTTNGSSARDDDTSWNEVLNSEAPRAKPGSAKDTSPQN